MLRSFAASGALLIALTLAACGGNGDGGGDRLTVVASNTILADLAQVIAGEEADVKALIPAGADPHTFDPSPADARAVTEADIIFVNGLGLEEVVMGVINANISSDTPLVVIADELAELGVQPRGRLGTPEEGQAVTGDPHMWLDPNLAMRYVEIMTRELTILNPDESRTYSDREEEFRRELLAIDSDTQEIVASIPPQNRTLISTHASFQYYAGRYGLTFAFVLESPGKDTSPGDVADIANLIEDQGAPAVFVEPQVSGTGRVLELAAKDAGAEVCTLYSDALDDRVPTYLDLLRFDAQEIARCLGGDGD